MTEKRKTFRDYILEGGIKGRYFAHRCHSWISVYKVMDIERPALSNYIWVSSAIFYSESGFPVVVSKDFDSCFDDEEATPKEVQSFRAKESKLVQKAAKTA